MQLLEAKPLPFHAALVFLLLTLPCAPDEASAKPSGFHRPTFEQAVGDASLILVARVARVHEATVLAGGKMERVIRTFDFEPVNTLKGVFARDELELTSNDLEFTGWPSDPGWAPLPGELRLILLGRSSIGYRNVHLRSRLDDALPVVDSPEGPLVRTTARLIALTQEPDRRRGVDLLLDGLATTNGRAAIPLLESLEFRALVAAQHPQVVAVARLLDDPVPETRAAAARTLGSILESDYLANAELAEQSVAALLRLLERPESSVAARVAALEAIGFVPPSAASGIPRDLLRPQAERKSWAEQAAALRAIGRQRNDAYATEARAFAEQLKLDADASLTQAALTAVIRGDSGRAAGLIRRRIENKHRAGLDAAVALQVIGDLPTDDAVALLTSLAPGDLSHEEKNAFAEACRAAPDVRLIQPLAELLGPEIPDVHWRATEALLEIDAADAAEALQPYLPRERNLERKLEIAAYLARHGIDVGMPYALEHMAEASLLEPAVAVFDAVSGRDAVPTLREIVRTGNDTAWTGAAIRGLAALGAQEIVPRVLEIAEDLRHPLAPYALVALGQIGPPHTAGIFREAIRSRDERIVVSAIRGAAALLARGEAEENTLRDDIARLLTSTGAGLEVRAAALDALTLLDDARLDAALAAAAVDARLETTPLLARIEELLEERSVAL